MNTFTTTPKRLRERLDTLLVDAGFFPTREKARSAIMAGWVRQGTQLLSKPGVRMAELPADLVVKGDPCPYVSRGGLKMAGALPAFGIDPQDRLCLDVGASTGGFTDCLLQAGARQVYAVDVGYNQLAWKLRQDPRVVSREKVNARYLTPAELYGDEHTEKATLAVMDVSFISILKILPALADLLTPDGVLISLIKPQFEAPQSDNHKGIVRDPAAHLRVLESILSGAPATGWHLHGAITSPIRGKGGNREFLGVFYRSAPLRPPELAKLARETDPPEPSHETHALPPC